VAKPSLFWVRRGDIGSSEYRQQNRENCNASFTGNSTTLALNGCALKLLPERQLSFRFRHSDGRRNLVFRFIPVCHHPDALRGMTKGNNPRYTTVRRPDTQSFAPNANQRAVPNAPLFERFAFFKAPDSSRSQIFRISISARSERRPSFFSAPADLADLGRRKSWIQTMFGVRALDV